MTKGLPDGWIQIELGKVCKIASGGTPKTDIERYWGNEIPWITPADMAKDRSQTLFDGRRGLSREGYESCSAQLLPKGSVIFSSRAPIGYVAIAGNDLATNQGCKSAFPSSAVDAKYLYWYLVFATPEIEERASGTTFKEISGKKFAETKLVLPPLAEQRRIVVALEDHLSRLDAATNYFEAGVRKTKTLSQSVANRAVSGKLVDFPSPGTEKDLHLEALAHRALVAPKRRLRPAVMAAQFPTTVPTHWNVVALDELATLIEYGTSTKTRAQEKSDDVPVLRMGNIQDGGLDLSSLKYLPADHMDVTKLALTDGDLLFNRTNSAELVGKTAIYRAKLGPMTFASYLIRCQFAPGVIPEWVSMVINSTYGRQYIAAVSSQQVGQANVSGSKLAAMPIPLPSTEEQEYILAASDDFKSKASHFASILAMSRSKSTTMRRSLLIAAFSGKLVPQNPEDEPASVLLERIKAEQLAAKKQPKVRRAPGTRFALKQTNHVPSGPQEELPL
ncbi:restriction endonuclease subunit S [Streptomyces sp. NPDC056227]|uniref:restriction endonuclease subunit S n=1 Tax=Streptomyces sp. NPDC056227 TaxID=3345753 RepID=UPI0035E286CA